MGYIGAFQFFWGADVAVSVNPTLLMGLEQRFAVPLLWDFRGQDYYISKKSLLLTSILALKQLYGSKDRICVFCVWICGTDTLVVLMLFLCCTILYIYLP